MKVAIITDQHLGFKKGSKLYHDYFLKFYEEVFFPTLEREGITTILDLGDTFDNRKGVDSYSRYIYIHGTPEEWLLGTKASKGCIRMSNIDVIDLFDRVYEGMIVNIK